MRLTPDVVLHARQALDCIGERTLYLRDKGIPVIENLAVARDSFDCIDLSANAISILGHGFPPFPRLARLYLACNRITKIQNGVADSLPNLRVLVLTSNRIATRANLNITELARFKHLEVLAFADNPVESDTGLRLLLLHHVPSLRFINFSRVTDKERKAARQQHSEKEKGAVSLKKRRLANTSDRYPKKIRVQL